MEWWLALLIILGCFLVLLAVGVPVAFAFLFTNLVGAFFFWGGEAGLKQLVLSIVSALASYALPAVILYILMGEVVFVTGIAARMIGTLDGWIGRIPGRLSLEAVGAGTVFATLSGSAVSGVALLGTSLVPEMEKLGYKKPMLLGPVLASGGLAQMIPPSVGAIVLAFIAKISVGRVLFAIIIPGLMMACFYAVYIVIRCWLQPSIAPASGAKQISLSKKLIDSVKYLLPLVIIIFLVLGTVFLGICTPSEAAAVGALGAIILAAFYRGVNWDRMKKSFMATARITTMVFMIVAGATAFSQILAFSGVARSIVGLISSIDVAPIMIVIIMQIILLIMGCFMEAFSIMMVAVPIFFPIIVALGFDPIWFAVLFLLNMECGGITPPFGLSLFVMKGVAPSNCSMGDIILAGMPFLGLNMLVMALLIIFPALTMWIPDLMFKPI